MPDPNVQRSRPKPCISVSVREMVEFLLRSGDLAGGREFAGPARALAGTRGHQRVQRSRPEEYKTEVPVCVQLETPKFVLTIRGRIDGVIDSPREVLIEEIKTIRGRGKDLPDPIHWAQAKVYACLFIRESSAEQVAIRLAYLDLNTDRVTEHLERFTRREIEAFFSTLSARYLEWVSRQVRWRQIRDASVSRLAFPYPRFRTGQEELMEQTLQMCAGGGTLFAEAPTGIGKTLSIIFPAVQALGCGDLERIFFLTAKTVGRRAAEKALEEMRGKGLRLRSLSLTSREKMCFNEGRPCDVRACSYAIGYYDRVRGAIAKLLEKEAMNDRTIEEIAREEHVCPHALAMDVSSWSDVVICDYNYVFDPNVQLKRFFSDGAGDYGFLIDEAHNLVDRARDMYSADLTQADLDSLKEASNGEIPACGLLVGELRKRLGAPARQAAEGSGAEERPAVVSKEVPSDLLFLVRSIVKQLEEWLAQDRPSLFREAILNGYFQFLKFSRTADSFDGAYVSIVESPARRVRFRLFCLDPSARIQQVLRRGKVAVFFSATLSPIEYFRRALCGRSEERVFRLGSPFPPENLRVIISGRIATTLRQRAFSYGVVAQTIVALAQSRAGNYLIFFPSYDYLNKVLDETRSLRPQFRIEAQSPRMTEAERDAFLMNFRDDQRPALVGFAVMGGLFGEGIDLIGKQLVGAVIVGVGLPQVSLERELIRKYFDDACDAGFDYAYTFPGMNRVLQAAGRVIRSETDRGIILLIDARFGQSRYRQLFPSWWRAVSSRNVDDVKRAAEGFWKGLPL